MQSKFICWKKSFNLNSTATTIAITATIMFVVSAQYQRFIISTLAINACTHIRIYVYIWYGMVCVPICRKCATQTCNIFTCIFRALFAYFFLENRVKACCGPVAVM